MSDLTPNSDPFLQNPYPDDEIDLKEFLMGLWFLNDRTILDVASRVLYKLGAIGRFVCLTSLIRSENAKNKNGRLKKHCSDVNR